MVAFCIEAATERHELFLVILVVSDSLNVFPHDTNKQKYNCAAKLKD